MSGWAGVFSCWPGFWGLCREGSLSQLQIRHFVFSQKLLVFLFLNLA